MAAAQRGEEVRAAV
uniref:Uncharacterized protein n=1 Tax=Arundo donax TaxID=35708 RepID=A0A0A8YRJ7_ARUDO